MNVPSSTYRLQLQPGFTCADAAALVPVLADLGIGALYLSPMLQAHHGSVHGYDTVDHGRVDASRGGREGLEHLGRACRAHGLGLVFDIVPNHMGIAEPQENAPFYALLAEGQVAWSAAWFDVDWEGGEGRVVLPVLDDRPLEDQVAIEGDELVLGSRRLPLRAGRGPEGLDDLVALVDDQHYRLVPGTSGDEVLNYRRFFAVADLAAVRVEDPGVFDATHAEIKRWLQSDLPVVGLRVDHPDGLADPSGYLGRLRDLAPGSWTVVEKITAPGEDLPASWPVEGATGYDALAEVTKLFLDPDAEGAVDACYRRLTGDERDWAAHAADGKRLVATTLFRAELRRLLGLLPQVAGAREALVELATALPRYRAYLPGDASLLRQRAATVAEQHKDLAAPLQALLPALLDPLGEAATRFQQLSGAVMAKGVEDTAYYRDARFVALNEVGGAPDRFGWSPEAFHAAQVRRLALTPHGMTTLSTHDTKRGEDTRARLLVLAEVLEAWETLAAALLEHAPIPNRRLAYLLWQSLVGAWPIGADRAHAYAEKAMREASEETSWQRPDATFEAAVHDAVDRVLAPLSASVDAFVRAIAPYTRANRLGQKLVQLTMPGVPDCYQGAELDDRSLVDPDNRAPLDPHPLADALAVLAAGPPGRDTPAEKLFVARHALTARRERPDAFSSYAPLSAEGPAAAHCVAFDRGGAVTVATRLPAGLAGRGGFGETVLTLPDGAYLDALTGRPAAGSVVLAEALDRFPVALFLRGGPT